MTSSQSSSERASERTIAVNTEGEKRPKEKSMSEQETEKSNSTPLVSQQLQPNSSANFVSPKPPALPTTPRRRSTATTSPRFPPSPTLPPALSTSSERQVPTTNLQSSARMGVRARRASGTHSISSSPSSIQRSLSASTSSTKKKIFTPFPWPLTAKQWFYIGVTQCLVAACVDGGANFGIAYAMYHSYGGPGKKPVKMWVFSQNTIAGDLGVTPLIQTAVSMIITSTLVHTDLHHHQIKPLPFVYPHVEHLPDPMSLFRRKQVSNAASSTKNLPTPDVQQRRNPFVHAWLMLLRFIFEGTEMNMLLSGQGGIRGFFARLVWTAAQGVALGIFFGFPLWCLAIVILGPIYQNKNMGGRWAPEAIKLVYGFILGAITNPVIATIALGSQAEHHLVEAEQDASAGSVHEREEGDGRNERFAGTLAEEEEMMETPPLPRFLTPRSGRRPSLIADVSQMLIPSSPSMPTAAPTTATITKVQATPSRRPPNRPRAGTTASNASSFYSLGGTGGRAQRRRADSYQHSLSSNFNTNTNLEGARPPIPSFNTPTRSEFPTSDSLAPPIVGVGPPPAFRSSPSVLRAEEAPRESMELRADEDSAL